MSMINMSRSCRLLIKVTISFICGFKMIQMFIFPFYMRPWIKNWHPCRAYFPLLIHNILSVRKISVRVCSYFWPLIMYLLFYPYIFMRFLYFELNFSMKFSILKWLYIFCGEPQRMPWNEHKWSLWEREKNVSDFCTRAWSLLLYSVPISYLTQQTYQSVHRIAISGLPNMIFRSKYFLDYYLALRITIYFWSDPLRSPPFSCSAVYCLVRVTKD